MGRYIDFYWYPGAWRRPSEWVWGRDESCDIGCTIVDLSFFQVTIYAKGHRP